LRVEVPPVEFFGYYRSACPVIPEVTQASHAGRETFPVSLLGAANVQVAAKARLEEGNVSSDGSDVMWSELSSPVVTG